MFVGTSPRHPWQWSPLVILPARFPKKLISVVVRLLLASVLSFYYYTVFYFESLFSEYLGDGTLYQRVIPGQCGYCRSLEYDEL